MNRQERRLGLDLLSVLASILLVVYPGHNTAFGQNSTSKETLQNLLRAYESRAEQRNPIWVHYTLTRITSAAFQKATRQPESEDDIPRKDEVEYAVQGVKTRSWKMAVEPPVPDHAWRKEDFRIYTGELVVWPSNKPGTFMISKRPNNEVVAPTPWGIIGEDRILDTLKGWKEGKNRITNVSLAEQRTANGDRVSIVELTYSTKWRSKAWFLPDKGWALQRLEVYNGNNEPVDISEVEAFENYAGLDLPKQGYAKHFVVGGAVGQTLSFEVTAVERRAANIPDSIFRVNFPPDADIWDTDNGETVRNAGLSQSHLDEVVRRMESPGASWRAWLGIALLAACVIMGGLVVYTAYRRRRAKVIG